MLSDAEKRRQYDQFGHAAFEGGAGGAGAGGFDFDFGDMGDIFGDLFGGMFGGGGSRRNSNGPRRGADVRVNVRITFDESVRGTTKKIDVTLRMSAQAVTVQELSLVHHQRPVANVVAVDR